MSTFGSREHHVVVGAERDPAGRITVEADLTLLGHPEVFAIGDMIRVRDPEGEPVVLPV